MIKKAILPVAGMGTRFLPITKSSPKEMLPIIDKPVIQYIVEEAVNSGIEEIIFVTGKGKRAIEDYFDSDPELFRTLKMKKKEKELKELKKLENIAKIVYVRQAQALGDGHAILSASHCISKNEDFAVLFGDDIIDNNVPALRQLIDVYNNTQTSVIGVQEIIGKDIESYGVVGGEKNQNIIHVNNLVEKPLYAEALSKYGIIGKYICRYDVLAAIAAGEQNPGEELRLIDGFKYLLKNNVPLSAKIIEGDRYDTGSKIGWLKANIAFAKKQGMNLL
jgi:UTP--glucose-1-phosphate uridylyltransferase